MELLQIAFDHSFKDSKPCPNFANWGNDQWYFLNLMEITKVLALNVCLLGVSEDLVEVDTCNAAAVAFRTLGICSLQRIVDQCAQIENRGTYKHNCTPYPCEASRERWRGALLLFFPCRSRTLERLLLLLLILLAPSSLPTRFTHIRRAIVSVGTLVCNLSTLLWTLSQLCELWQPWEIVGQLEEIRKALALNACLLIDNLGLVEVDTCHWSAKDGIGPLLEG